VRLSYILFSLLIIYLYNLYITTALYGFPMATASQYLQTFQAFWEHIRDIVLIFDTDGKVFDVNEMATKAYGYEREEFKTLSVEKLRAPEARADLAWQMSEAFSHGLSVRTLHQRKDGSTFPVDVSSHSIIINDKTFLLSVARDITDYKNAEAELQAVRASLEKANETLERKVVERTVELETSQKSLRAIIDTVMDPIFVKDRQHRWIEGNAAFWNLLGGEEKAKGKSDYDLFPKQQADLFWQGDEKVFNGTPFDEEEILRKPGGADITIATKKISFTMANGEKGLVGVIRDVTQQRDMEAELRRHRDHLLELVDEKMADIQRQRRLYETTLSNTPDLVYMFDLQHRFIYANAALLKMWGRTWEESIGKNCHELGYESWHAEMHGRELEQVIKTKQPIRGDVPFNGTNGKRVYDYIFVPVIGENGEVEAVTGTTRDVTESREMESTLRDADQKKDEFLAMLAHELRNPLAPIRNALYLMQSKNANADILECARQVMERQVNQMVRLVDDLMDVSRITRGKIELQKQDIVLSEVIQNAVETATPLIQQKQHQLTVDMPPDLIHLNGDFVRLSQVFTNLLNNAAKYTNSGGKIAVQVRAYEDHAEIDVSDNGAGISPDMTSQIFEMFSQVDNSIERTNSGLGIGLTISKHLIELHKGLIRVSSKGLAHGTTFTVILPIANPKASFPQGQAGLSEYKTPGACSKKVLVVDDNLASAQTLGWTMELLGYETTVVNHGKDALNHVKNHTPDVVLLDIGMPDINGYEICKEMKKMPGMEKTIFIAQTGWGQKEHLEKSKSVGFHHHFVKPIDLRILEKILALHE
jgi:PAS domain S-box-containing protein